MATLLALARCFIDKDYTENAILLFTDAIKGVCFHYIHKLYLFNSRVVFTVTIEKKL